MTREQLLWTLWKNRGLQLLASALDASRPILHHRLWLEQFRPFRSSVLWLPSGFITSAWSAHRSRKIGSSGWLSWIERKRVVWLLMQINNLRSIRLIRLTVVSLMRTRSANSSTFYGQGLQDVTKEIRNRSSWELTRWQTVLLHLSTCHPTFSTNKLVSKSGIPAYLGMATFIAEIMINWLTTGRGPKFWDRKYCRYRQAGPQQLLSSWVLPQRPKVWQQNWSMPSGLSPTRWYAWDRCEVNVKTP